MTDNTSFLPVYDFSPELNAEFLRKILPLMVRNNIPVNPINYAIWYDYVIGSNPKLNEVVNKLISEQKTFDADTSFQVYQRYICNASLVSFERIHHQVQDIISSTKASIEDTHSKTQEANTSFQKNTTALEQVSNEQNLKDVLKEIMQQTSALASSSMLMQNSLEEANKKMEQMRIELTEVRQIALTDALTGLLNRRAFDQAIADLLPLENNTPTCLAIIDIDHFKRINDTHGHNVGDQVIKYVATLMKKNTEPHHSNARYGGEEMTIVMPNTTKERAVEIAENIRNTMEKSLLKRKDTGEQLHKITVSIGISQLRATDNADSFVARADKALYKAKETGRNRVIKESD